MKKADAAKLLRTYIRHTAPHVDRAMAKNARSALARLTQAPREYTPVPGPIDPRTIEARRIDVGIAERRG